MDAFKARAKGLSDGLEPELSVVVDVMFPLEQLTCAVAAFQTEFAATPLTLYVEALGAVLQPVMDGRCAFGVMGSLPTAPAQLTRQRLLVVGMAFVASPTHSLASLKGPIPARVLALHRQLVLTDRSELSKGKDFGVFSSNTWRLADLGAKHAFLLAGLGWGAMPVAVIETDLANRSLVKIDLEDVPDANLVMPMYAVFLTDTPPGPAGRWLIERLKSNVAPRARPAKAPRRPGGTPAGVARNRAAHLAKRRGGHLPRIAELGDRFHKTGVVPAPDSSIREQASAGTQWRWYERHWIPACAGMTILGMRGSRIFVMLASLLGPSVPDSIGDMGVDPDY